MTYHDLPPNATVLPNGSIVLDARLTQREDGLVLCLRPDGGFATWIINESWATFMGDYFPCHDLRGALDNFYTRR